MLEEGMQDDNDGVNDASGCMTADKTGTYVLGILCDVFTVLLRL